MTSAFILACPARQRTSGSRMYPFSYPVSSRARPEAYLAICEGCDAMHPWLLPSSASALTLLNTAFPFSPLLSSGIVAVKQEQMQLCKRHRKCA